MSTCNFSDLKIGNNILKALDEMALEEPTEVQSKAIPLLLKTEQNFVARAQTGSGKTIAFLVPLLQKMDTSQKTIQGIILAPTRELAIQIETEIQKIGKYSEVRSISVYGGVAYEKQINNIQKLKPHIIVGTPGRVVDLVKKKILKLEETKYCVLDEVDEILKVGFFDDVQNILGKVASKSQLMMFSATTSEGILKLIKKSFKEHIFLEIKKELSSHDNIEQKYVIVKDKHFKEALARLIDFSPETYGIVFCRTKIETKIVGDDLKERGNNVEVLTGDMGQVERDLAMKNFKKKKVNLLVCTDVAARGIDVNNLTHIFNYGPPRDSESYVHRIGRTGRAGMKGVAITLLGPKSAYLIKELELYTHKKMSLEKLPTVEDLKRKLVEKEIEGASDILLAIKNKGEHFKTEPSYSLFENEFGDLPREELLKLMFVWKFNKNMRRYNNLADIESTASSAPRKRVRRTQRKTS